MKKSTFLRVKKIFLRKSDLIHVNAFKLVFIQKQFFSLLVLLGVLSEEKKSHDNSDVTTSCSVVEIDRKQVM